MTGNYWILRHPSMPGVVSLIAQAEVNDTPALLDLPAGMVYENVDVIPLEDFLARAKAAQR